MDYQDKDLCRLAIAGITYHQINSGAFVLVLREVDGDRRIPIVIGTNEAQSIECKLQEIITPRPLTHDLIANIFRAFGLQLVKIVIKRLDTGVYAADLHLRADDRNIVLDSRSSDAVAIAIRVGAPIFTTAQLLEEAGMKQQRVDPIAEDEPMHKPQSQPDSLEQQTLPHLEKMLEEAVEEEKYELAARIKKIIQSKRKQDNL